MIKPTGERDPAWAEPTPWDLLRQPTWEYWKHMHPRIRADAPDPGFELHAITYHELRAAV